MIMLPKYVDIVEVGPRDGLQNEEALLDVSTRVALIEKLELAGLKRIEVGSFVSPKWVPQMAHSGEVLDVLNKNRLHKNNNTRYSVLTPNLMGLESAISCNAEEVAIFTAASETFSQKNINCSIQESLNRFEPLILKAKSLNIPVRGYVSTVIGCPYEGDIDPKQVTEVAIRLYQMGCYEISLGDTIGVGTPRSFSNMLESVMAKIPVTDIAVHCHNTYGQALANIYRCLQLGVSTIDSSVAGLGGCPYAKGASGNVATEDVLYLLNGLDISTDIELNKVIETSQWICNLLNRENKSNVTIASC